MNVKWEDVKADYARKDAEIETLKAMNAELEGKLANLRQSKDDNESSYIAKILSVNAELVEALEEIIGGGKEIDDIELMKEIAVDALAKAKELNHETI